MQHQNGNRRSSSSSSSSSRRRESSSCIDDESIDDIPMAETPAWAQRAIEYQMDRNLLMQYGAPTRPNVRQHLSQRTTHASATSAIITQRDIERLMRQDSTATSTATPSSTEPIVVEAECTVAVAECAPVPVPSSPPQSKHRRRLFFQQNQRQETPRQMQQQHQSNQHRRHPSESEIPVMTPRKNGPRLQFGRRSVSEGGQQALQESFPTPSSFLPGLQKRGYAPLSSEVFETPRRRGMFRSVSTGDRQPPIMPPLVAESSQSSSSSFSLHDPLGGSNRSQTRDRNDVLLAPTDVRSTPHSSVRRRSHGDNEQQTLPSERGPSILRRRSNEREQMRRRSDGHVHEDPRDGGRRCFGGDILRRGSNGETVRRGSNGELIRRGSNGESVRRGSNEDVVRRGSNGRGRRRGPSLNQSRTRASSMPRTSSGRMLLVPNGDEPMTSNSDHFSSTSRRRIQLSDGPLASFSDHRPSSAPRSRPSLAPTTCSRRDGTQRSREPRSSSLTRPTMRRTYATITPAPTTELPNKPTPEETNAAIGLVREVFPRVDETRIRYYAENGKSIRTILSVFAEESRSVEIPKSMPEEEPRRGTPSPSPCHPLQLGGGMPTAAVGSDPAEQSVHTAALAVSATPEQPSIRNKKKKKSSDKKKKKKKKLSRKSRRDSGNEDSNNSLPTVREDLQVNDPSLSFVKEVFPQVDVERSKQLLKKKSLRTVMNVLAEESFGGSGMVH